MWAARKPKQAQVLNELLIAGANVNQKNFEVYIIQLFLLSVHA